MTKSEEVAQELAQTVSLRGLTRLSLWATGVTWALGAATLVLLGVAAWQLSIRLALVALVVSLPFGIASNISRTVAQAVRLKKKG